MKKLTTICIAVLVFASAAAAHAQNTTRKNTNRGPTVRRRVSQGRSNGLQHWRDKFHKGKKKGKMTYRVELYHPAGGLAKSAVFDRRDQAEAQRSRYAKYYWRRWQYVGIGEPFHYAGPFDTYNKAAKHPLPIGVVGDQRVLPGRVQLKEIPVKRGK